MAAGGWQPQQLCPQPCAGTGGPCAQATRQVPFLSHVTASPATYGATPQDGRWPALPPSAPAHTAVTLPSCPCSHSQGCSQQSSREWKGGSPGQGTAQGCGTRGCSGSSVATHGSLSGATQHSHGVTPLPSSLNCVPNCHHAGRLQGCQCPPAPRCAQPCFGDSRATTVSSHHCLHRCLFLLPSTHCPHRLGHPSEATDGCRAGPRSLWQWGVTP